MALFEGEVFLGSEDHSEFGPIFALTISAPRRHAQGIEGFFNLIQLELEENSIYRGKAFTASAQPESDDPQLPTHPAHAPGPCPQSDSL